MGEFETIMRARDEVEGLHNCLKTVTVETEFKINQGNVEDGLRGYNNELREQTYHHPTAC